MQQNQVAAVAQIQQQAGIPSAEADRNLRLELVQGIKSLSKEQLNLLGFVMSTPQYKDLDDLDPSIKKEDQENTWR